MPTERPSYCLLVYLVFTQVFLLNAIPLSARYHVNRPSISNPEPRSEFSVEFSSDQLPYDKTRFGSRPPLLRNESSARAPSSYSNRKWRRTAQVANNIYQNLSQSLTQLLAQFNDSFNTLIQSLKAQPAGATIEPFGNLTSSSETSGPNQTSIQSSTSIESIFTAPPTPTTFTSVSASSSSPGQFFGAPSSSSSVPSGSLQAPSPETLPSPLTVVYYAQTPITSSVPIGQICADADIDIIILGFITDFFSSNSYPSLNLGPKCWAANAIQKEAGATGLLDCVSDGFASEIAECQSRGKKVMLSLGGAISNTSLPGDEDAVELANTLWNLFLGGVDEPSLRALRPFGQDVILDGIDIDNESPDNAAHIPALVSELRALFATGSGKQYYLSAAPQCPRPDASIPIPDIVSNLDFVNVQFYNNPSCQLNAGQGFLDSVQAWSDDLSASSAKLLIGAPAWSGGGTGFVDPTDFRGLMEQAKGLNLPNLGGAMFWDGAYEVLSGGSGESPQESFGQVLKAVFR